MVNIRIKKMNEALKKYNLHQFQAVDADILKDWIEEMEAGKWHNNRFHMTCMM